MLLLTAVVGLVPNLPALVLLVLVKVVVAVRQAEAALIDLQQRPRRVLLVGTFVDREEDVHAVLRLQRGDGGRRIVDRAVAHGEQRRQRRQPSGLDGLLVLARSVGLLLLLLLLLVLLYSNPYHLLFRRIGLLSRL